MIQLYLIIPDETAPKLTAIMTLNINYQADCCIVSGCNESSFWQPSNTTIPSIYQDKFACVHLNRTFSDIDDSPKKDSCKLMDMIVSRYELFKGNADAVETRH